MLKRPLVVFGLVTLVSTSACVTSVPQIQRIDFPNAEYELLATEGTGVVQGQAFLRQNGGGVVTCAGQEVNLTPVTKYTEQSYSVYLSGEGRYQKPILSHHDPRFYRYIKSTTGDVNGEFEFTDLPAGDYYIQAVVEWKVGSSTQGGILMTKVTVNDGIVSKVLMSKMYELGHYMLN